MRCWLFTAVVMAGCYKPTLQTGSPCDAANPCPAGLVCSAATSTCETSSSELVDAGLEDAVDAQILVDGCTPAPEFCGDGMDQNCDGIDQACPPNDLPGGAIDVTAGGNRVDDVRYANDDAAKPTGNGPCGGTGGRDLFYKIHLTADETYYLDTFGSDFDTVIRVYHGACMTGAAPGGMATKCHNDQCATTQSQGTYDLTAGDTCIVIDQLSNAETKGSLHLRIERGQRTGFPLATGVHTTAGTTVGGSDQSSGTCTQDGNDVGYYFTACPSQTFSVSATTCNAATTWDTAVYLRGPPNAGNQVVCNDDDANCVSNGVASTISTTVTGNHLYYLIVDAAVEDAADPFELDTDIH